LSSIYLIRHGQAGLRTNYDTLSSLGRLQSRLLGESFIAQQIRFQAAFSGDLTRQRETGAEISATYARAGLPFPPIQADPHWSEFDLDAVYRELAPILARQDARFRSEYEEMLGQLADGDHEIHRQWSRCDRMVVRAWTEGSLPCETETWQAFQDRVARTGPSLAAFSADENVAVFTSATPIGVWAGIALEAGSRVRLNLAGALYNSAYAVLRFSNGKPSLFSFNNCPHLIDAQLRTFR